MYGVDEYTSLLWVTGAGGSGKSRLLSLIGTDLEMTGKAAKLCAISIPRFAETTSIKTPWQALRFFAYERAVRNAAVFDRLLGLAKSGLVLDALSFSSIWQLLFMDEIFRIEPELYVVFNGYDRFEPTARTEFLYLLSNVSLRYPLIRVLISGVFDVDTDRHLRARSAAVVNLDQEIAHTHAIARQMVLNTLRLDSDSEIFEIIEHVATHLDQRLFHVKVLILALQELDGKGTESSRQEALKTLQRLSISDLYEMVEGHLITRADSFTKDAFLTFKNLTFHRQLRLGLDGLVTTITNKYASVYAVPVETILHRTLKESRCRLAWTTMLHESNGTTAKLLYSWLHAIRKHDILRFQPDVRTVWRFSRPVKSSWLIFSRQTEAVAHWGVIVSDFNRSQLQHQLSQATHKSTKHSSTRVGELHELQRDGSYVRHTFRTCTLEEFVGSQKVVISLHYIGETSLTDEEIIDQGSVFPIHC
jgi:hypothetical protein